MTALEIMRDPSRWCRGALARDRDGRGVSYKSADACSFCIVGAIALAYPDRETCDRVTMKVGKVVRGLYKRPALTTFNNDPGTTFEMVQKALEGV